MTIQFPLKRFTVFSNSMLPTLKPGQNVLVWCWFVKSKIGDIIAIKHEGKEIIKRIQNIRGRELFVTGDNKKESTDSREFGWVKEREIIGKIVWYQ